MNYSSLNKPFLTALLSVCLLYIVGYLWPERFWGVNFFRFLEGEYSLALILIVFAIALLPIQLLNRIGGLVEDLSRYNGLLVALVISFIYGILVYSFPIAYDPYGDAVRFQDHLDKIASVSPLVYDYLFGFSLDAWSGEKSVLALVTVVSHHLNITHGETFRLIDAVSAVLFSLSWMTFLYSSLSEKTLIMPLYFVGLIGPYGLVFHGHAEIYAPAIAIMMLWVLVLKVALQRKSIGFAVLLLIINLVVIKLHPIGVMLMPSALVVMLTNLFDGKFLALQDGRLLPIVLVPLVLTGLLVYFFILGDHLDDRSLQITAKQYDHLFLPLFSPDPPLHKYNLFSLNHIIDFFNVLLMGSPVMLLLLIAGIYNGKRFKIRDLEIFIHLVLSLILILMLLFAINPLLSMPMDWDLFMLFVPVMFGCAVVGLTPNLQTIIRNSVPLMLSVAFLSGAFIVSSQNVNNISDRLRSIAIHVHDTYYEWTMNIIDRSFAISTESMDVLDHKRHLLREKLRANAPEWDREFSEFLRQDAKQAYKVRSDYSLAKEFLDQAFKYNPNDGNNHLTGVELNFELKNMNQALFHGRELVKMAFPDKETSLRIAIHCAIEAESYSEAQGLCAQYLSEFENTFILKVYTRLVTGDDIDSLKFLFQRTG